ncbi:MAG: magnesium transporter [Micrococcales bacterium]|nr:magnesium transporter [Micrococcales bacterium]
MTTTREVRRAIVSVAGLVGAPVRNQVGQQIGRVIDVVARMHAGDRYPPITGVLIRVGWRTSFLSVTSVGAIAHRSVSLKSSRLDLRDFLRRPGEVILAKDVLDHQLIDIDGRQVIRAADLYLAPVGADFRLVGVDVSLATLLRRLGPRLLRGRPTPDRVIDWDAISPFGDTLTSGPSSVRLRTSDDSLRRLLPGDLAVLLEDLGRSERHALLARLDRETAADALEEMDPDELEALLREVEPRRAAELVSAMEPDEAVDALRDLSPIEREDILALIPEPTRQGLAELLAYPERTAGGFMTTVLARAHTDDTIGDVQRLVAELGEHRQEIDAILILDREERLVADLSLFDLIVHPVSERIDSVLQDEHDHPPPLTVLPGAPVAEVAEQLLRTRRPSVLVVDETGQPVGRILADDVLDALLPERGRRHFPRLLQ